MVYEGLNIGDMTQLELLFTKAKNFLCLVKLAGLKTWQNLSRVIALLLHGIAHTRWATHGAVTVANTHPHVSHDGRFVMVHNGVIENFGSLKRFLTGKGIEFKSETDSEILCNLIAYHYSELSDGEDRFIEAVR